MTQRIIAHDKTSAGQLFTTRNTEIHVFIIHVVSPSCQSRACPKPEADAHFLVQCLVVVYSFVLSLKTVTVVYELLVTYRLSKNSMGLSIVCSLCCIFMLHEEVLIFNAFDEHYVETCMIPS